MKIPKKIIAPVISLVALLAMGIGTTYALFTSSADTNVAITAGKVKLNAEVTDLTLFSAFDASQPTAGYNFETYEVGGQTVKYVQLDEYGYPYYSQIMGGTTFKTGGKATYDAGILSLVNVVPGDKAQFTVNFDNLSNVAIKYRIVVECLDQDDQSLKFFSRLHFTYGDEDLSKVRKFTTDWITKQAPDGVPEQIDPEVVSVKLPLTEGNDIQESTCHLRILVEGVQANAHTEGTSQKLLIDYVEEVVEKDDDQKLVDVQLEAGEVVEEQTQEEETLCTVYVPLSKNTVEAQTTPTETEPVKVNDKINLTVKQKESIEEGTVVIPTNTEVLSFDVSLTNQDGKKILSTEENIEVQLYVGLGRSIQGVYHNGEEVTNYTYEDGVITIYTKSFSEYAVTYYDPSKLEGTCRIDDRFYETVKEGAAALQDGEKLVVFKDSNEPGLNNDCIQVHAKNTEIEVLDGVTITTSAGPQSILLSGLSSTNFTLSGRGKFVVGTMYSGSFINQGCGESGASAALWNVTLKEITVEFTDPTANNKLFGINGASSGPTASILSGNYKNCIIGDVNECLISGGRYSDAGCLNYITVGKAATQLDGTDGYLYKIEDFCKENAACYIEYDEVPQLTSISRAPAAEPIVEHEGGKVKAYYSTATRGLNNLQSNQVLNLLIDSPISGVKVDNVDNAGINLNGHELLDTVNYGGQVGPVPDKAALRFENVTNFVVDGGQSNSGLGSIVSKPASMNNGLVIAFEGAAGVQIKNTKLVVVGAQSQVLGFFGTAAAVEMVNCELSAESSTSQLFAGVSDTVAISMVSGKVLNHVDEALAAISPAGGEMKIDSEGKLVVSEHQSADPYDAKIVGVNEETRAYFSGDNASRSAILNADDGEKVYIKENVTVERTLPLGFTLTIVDESSEGAMWTSGYKPQDGCKVQIDHEAESKVYVLTVVEIKVCELTHSGVTTTYKTLKEAITAATSNVGDVIKFIDDATYSSSITVDKALTIDMNGHTLTFTKGRLISHTSSKQTTIKGSGMIYAKSGAAVQKGSSSGAKGQLMIYDVTLKSDTSYALDVTIGVCNIYSGTFIGKSGSDAVNKGWSCSSTYYLQFIGGTYSSDISTVADGSKAFLASGKKVVDNGDNTWSVVAQ